MIITKTLTYRELSKALGIPLTGKFGGIYRWVRDTDKKTVTIKLNKAGFHALTYELLEEEGIKKIKIWIQVQEEVVNG